MDIEIGIEQSNQYSYFDLRKSGEIPSQLTLGSTDYQNGTGDKIANFIQQVVTFFAGFYQLFSSRFIHLLVYAYILLHDRIIHSGLCVGLVKGWQLALVVLGATPIMGATFGIFITVTGKWSKKGQEAYAVAGGIADEAVSSIRTVNAFNAQEREAERYAEKLVR